jgi:F-type H+-transporting ATPase subunit c
MLFVLVKTLFVGGSDHMKMFGLVLMAVGVVLVTSCPVFAEGNAALTGPGMGAGIGAAITILGAGLGLGKIGSSALESMARQPEAAGSIQTAMIIIAALLEGVTFFSLIVCIILAGKAVGS